MVSSIRTDNIYKKNKLNVNNNRVINVNFPVNNDFKALFVLKLNVFLGFLLIASIFVSMISYSMVIAKENKLASINTRTSELSYENLDLQNKVDNAKSLYTINEKAEKINFLKKADKIMEVKNLMPVISTKRHNREIKIQPVLGY